VAAGYEWKLTTHIRLYGAVTRVGGARTQAINKLADKREQRTSALPCNLHMDIPPLCAVSDAYKILQDEGKTVARRRIVGCHPCYLDWSEGATVD